MVQDRTYEFRTTIDTISGGNLTRGTSSATNLLKNNQFLDKATNISQEFPKITVKLEQLSKLAKNKSIFDDKPEEFDDLSTNVKRDLSILNRRIQELKNTLKPAQTSPPTTNKTILEHEKNVILILQNWTALSFKSFENILEIRSQTLQSKKDRRDQFGGNHEASTGNFLSSFRPSTPIGTPSPASSTKTSPLKQRPIDPSFSSQPEFSKAFSQAPIGHIDSSSNNLGANFKKYDDQTHVSIDFSSQQQTLQMEQEPLLGTDSKNIRARNSALGAIESTINELGTIYQQLAHLVAEQGETIQRIDYNVDEMSTNVISGQNQLARYLRRVSSNRFLVAKMFIALILFIIIFKILFL